MEVIQTSINGLVLIKPRVFTDARGYFFESFSQKWFDTEVKPVFFVQDNQRASVRGVMRGLHFQRPPYSQAKLVRCVSGAVLDIAVDLRKSSPTYGKWLAVELSDSNRLQLFIPKGFAHGFAVLSDQAVFQYKCDNYYCPQAEGGIDLFDSTLDIDLPFKRGQAILSDKDMCFPTFDDFESPFE